MNEINVIKYYYLREILYHIVKDRSVSNLSNSDFKEFNKLFDKIKKYINKNYDSYCDLLLNKLITEIDIYNKVIEIQGSIIKNLRNYPFFLFLNESLTDITKKVLNELYDIKNRYNYGLLNLPIILPDTFNKDNYSILNNEPNESDDDGYVFLSNYEKPLEEKKSSFFSGLFKSSSKSQSASNKSTIDRLNFSKDINNLSQEIKLLSLKEKQIDVVNKSFGYDEEDKKINLSNLNDKINELLLILNNSSENYDILQDINNIRLDIDRIKSIIDTSKNLKQGNNATSEHLLELNLEDFIYNVNKSRLSLKQDDWLLTLKSIEIIIQQITNNPELTTDIPTDIKTTCQEIIQLLLEIKSREKEIQEFEQKKETIEKDTYDKLLKKKRLELKISNKRLKNSIKKEKNITSIFLKNIKKLLEKNKDKKISTYEKAIQLLKNITSFKSDNKEEITNNEVKNIESTLNITSDDLLNKLLEKLKNDRNNDELKVYLENYINNSKKQSEYKNSQLQDKTLLTNMKSSSLDASIEASTILKEKEVMIPKDMKIIMEDTIKMSKILKELVDKKQTSTTTNKTDNKNYKDLLEKLDTLNAKIIGIDADDEEYEKIVKESDFLTKSILDTLEGIDNMDNISSNNEELDNFLREFKDYVGNVKSVVENNSMQPDNTTLMNLEQINNDNFRNINHITIKKDDLFTNFFEGYK